MPGYSSIDPQAKYFPPRLLKKLDFSREYPMTLVEAPPGFGKTTLLEHFFSARIPQVIPRLTSDLKLETPSVCWQQICSQLQKIDPICGKRLLAAGIPDEYNLCSISQAIQEMNCSQETYLWLDSYQSLDISYSGEFLNMLANHGSSRLHIIVSSQTLSPETRGALLHNDRVELLLGDDLTFTQDDVSAYFSAAGLPLTQEQVADVCALTGGWVMALRLQMMSYITRGEFDQGCMETLMETYLWERMSPSVQSFLLKISIFPHVTLSQATFLSGWSAGKTERILQDKRYCIQYDSEKCCFYPHAQLRKLLQKHFSRLSKAEQKNIYLEGAKLALQFGDRIHTLQFYYLSGEWEQLLALPLTSYDIADIFSEDTKSIVMDILEHTSDKVKRKYPQAAVLLAFTLFLAGEYDRLRSILGEFEEIICSSNLDQAGKNALEGELELLLSFLEYNRIDAMSAHHCRALELLNGPSTLISPKSTWTFGSPSILYLYWREAGQLDKELEEMDTCMPIYYQLTRNHGFGAELVMRAEAHFLHGEINQALSLCFRSLLAADSRHQNSIYMCGLFLLCRIAIQKGDLELYNFGWQSMQSRAELSHEDSGRYTMDLAGGYISLLLGKPEEVAPWISEGAINEKRLVPITQPFAFILYGRCLLLRKEYFKLLGVSEYCLSLSSLFPNLLPQVYAHIYAARALAATGRKKDAVERLKKALAIAMPDRIYIPFMENFLGIAPLFQGLREYASVFSRISRIYGDCNLAWGVASQRFTPRENDILALIRENLTNKQIAEKLYLSPNTVRNIVSGMLKKKGFSSREQLKGLPPSN